MGEIRNVIPTTAQLNREVNTEKFELVVKGFEKQGDTKLDFLLSRGEEICISSNPGFDAAQNNTGHQPRNRPSSAPTSRQQQARGNQLQEHKVQLEPTPPE